MEQHIDYIQLKKDSPELFLAIAGRFRAVTAPPQRYTDDKGDYGVIMHYTADKGDTGGEGPQPYLRFHFQITHGDEKGKYVSRNFFVTKKLSDGTVGSNTFTVRNLREVLDWDGGMDSIIYHPESFTGIACDIEVEVNQKGKYTNVDVKWLNVPGKLPAEKKRVDPADPELKRLESLWKADVATFVPKDPATARTVAPGKPAAEDDGFRFV